MIIDSLDREAYRQIVQTITIKGSFSILILNY